MIPNQLSPISIYVASLTKSQSTFTQIIIQNQEIWMNVQSETRITLHYLVGGSKNIFFPKMKTKFLKVGAKKKLNK